jgi:hypothetical protein
MRFALPKRPLAVLIALPAMLLSSPSPASADLGSTIISRCTHGQSLSGFSQQAYNRALQELPTEVEEYSDCANLIRRAQLAAAGGHGGSSGGSSVSAAPIPFTPAERAVLKHTLTTVGSAPVRVGGRLVHPGVVRVDVASAVSSLPTPLLALLAFLLACGLLLAGNALRNRVRAHRSS